MGQVESKSTRAISALMKEIEPGSQRYEVLEVARKFKTSWVELGGKLWEVRSNKLFEQWGYKRFEEYCTGEIRIKPRTAAKLTASYGFLKNEEPSVLRRDGLERPVPDVQVVDLLRRMQEKEALPEKEFKKIKEMAFNDAPAAEVRREIREHTPPPEPPPVKKILKQLLAQAEKLADALAAVGGIPHVIVQRALALADDLRALAD